MLGVSVTPNLNLWIVRTPTTHTVAASVARATRDHHTQLLSMPQHCIRQWRKWYSMRIRPANVCSGTNELGWWYSYLSHSTLRLSSVNTVRSNDVRQTFTDALTTLYSWNTWRCTDCTCMSFLVLKIITNWQNTQAITFIIVWRVLIV